MARLIRDLASPVVNYSQLFACQGDVEPFEGDPSTRGCLTIKPQKQATAKAALHGNFHAACINTCMLELLVNVHGYCLMVKSVSCCCVHAWKPAFLKSGHICSGV